MCGRTFSLNQLRISIKVLGSWLGSTWFRKRGHSPNGISRRMWAWLLLGSAWFLVVPRRAAAHELVLYKAFGDSAFFLGEAQAGGSRLGAPL